MLDYDKLINELGQEFGEDLRHQQGLVAEHREDEKQNDSREQNTPATKEDCGKSNQYANRELTSA